MIKTGIIGGHTMAAGELIRILVNHPDVTIMWVSSPQETGRELTAVHRGLEGDTDARFIGEPTADDAAGLNAVFLCGEPWEARNFMALAGGDPELRVIDLTGAFRDGSEGMVYGLAEHNRKALVRGATRASLPSEVAMAAELALFPLAKNMLLAGDIDISASLASTVREHGAAAEADGDLAELSTRRDPVAPAENRPDAEVAAAEIARAMRAVQPTFHGETRVAISREAAATRGISVTAKIDCNQPLAELQRMFAEAYEDHGFTFAIDRRPEMADTANTNKCLIHIRRDENGLTEITAVIDNLLKGAAGNAVHCMNLLFGLSEKTGLALKGSAF